MLTLQPSSDRKKWFSAPKDFSAENAFWAEKLNFCGQQSQN
jgi:hypothetical protein